MKGTCIIFGGAGFIGSKLVNHLLKNDRFDKIYVADIQEPDFGNVSIRYHFVDVRLPIDISLFSNEKIDWIFNLAAICREPGFESKEYFETNILGAQNVCNFADKIKCDSIFFTSSMALYGPTSGPTDENSTPMPDTPYGISKLAAEYIHRVWVEMSGNRRLISVRPAVIYGPGDSGNILRMIRAVRSGYFILPVTPRQRKSYGYIYGLLDSIDFCLNADDKVIIYNYAESYTEDLGSMLKIIATEFNARPIILRFPLLMLKAIAFFLFKIGINFNGIHPERVKKVARPTHIIPEELRRRGFKFNYDLKSSIVHWKEISPSDFN